jgi:hypothetical protein
LYQAETETIIFETILKRKTTSSFGGIKITRRHRGIEFSVSNLKGNFCFQISVARNHAWQEASTPGNLSLPTDGTPPKRCQKLAQRQDATIGGKFRKIANSLDRIPPYPSLATMATSAFFTDLV